jgi:hypothetical protein
VYDDVRKNTSHVKYPNELRMCFGVASVDYGDGVRHGVRCKVFDYSARTIISIESFEEKIKEEISRVRALTGKCLPWVRHVHNYDEIYNDNTLIYLKKSIQQKV